MAQNDTPAACSNCFYADTRTRLDANNNPVSYLACLKNAPSVVTTDVAPSSNVQWPEVATTDWCGEHAYYDEQIYGQQEWYDGSISFTRFETGDFGFSGGSLTETFLMPPFSSAVVNATLVGFTSDGLHQRIEEAEFFAQRGANGNVTVFASVSNLTLGSISTVGAMTFAPNNVKGGVDVTWPTHAPVLGFSIEFSLMLLADFRFGSQTTVEF